MNYVIENIILYKTYLIVGLALGIAFWPSCKKIFWPATIALFAFVFGTLYWFWREHTESEFVSKKDFDATLEAEIKKAVSKLKRDLLYNERLKDEDRNILKKCYIKVYHPNELKEEFISPEQEENALKNYIYLFRWRPGDVVEEKKSN